jgi:hypothetical protein
MAERIDDIISKEAFDQVAKMDKGLSDLIKRFEGNANAVKLFNAALQGSDKMSQVTATIKQAATETAKLEAAQRQLAFANSEQGKELALLKVQIEENTRANKNAAKEMLATEGSVKQMNAQLIRLRGQWDNMSEALRKSPMGAELAKRINLVDTALKTLDSNTGRFQRNVGNYATATNSLSQVLREMPAFTYSVQTGILGISNNLPILLDQFKALRIETGSTSQALKIFAGSILSFPNLFTIAIGLITIFSDKIFETGEAANEAAEDIKTAGDALQSAYNSTDFKNALTNVTELRTRIDLAKKGIADKDETVKFYNETIGKTTGLVKDLDEAERELGANSEQYLRMILLRAAAHFALEEAAKKAVEAEKTRLKELEKIDPEKGKYGGFLEDIKHLASGDGKSMAEAAVDNVNEMVGGIKAEGKKLEDIGKQFLKDSLSIANTMNFNFNDDNKPEKDKKDKKDKKPENRIDAIKQQFENEKNLLDQQLNDQKISHELYYAKLSYLTDKYRQERDGLRQDEKDSEIKFNTELSKINADAYDKILESIDKEAEAQAKSDESNLKRSLKTAKDKYEHNKKAAEQELDLIKEWDRGWESFFDKHDKDDQENYEKKVKRLETLAQLVQMAGEIMSIAADIDFQREMAQIENRDKALTESHDKELKAIELSGKSKAQQEIDKRRLEAQTEAQRKRIDRDRIAAARKKARADKAADIANIITSTALAVVKAFTEGDPYTKAFRAAFAGAIGLANLARAAAAPLPQFAKGTNSAPGGLAVVSERGQELVIEPSGKKYLTPATESIINLPKGSKVIPNDELMKSVEQATMIKLGQGGAVTSQQYGDVMVEIFEQTLEENRKLRRVLEDKKMSVVINNNSEFDNWTKKYVK